MLDLQLILTVMALIVAGFVGFTIRLALESWRDWHVAKALHEAGLEEPVQRRYRRSDRHKRRIPTDVLARFEQALKTRKRAVMVKDSGRWRNAS